MATPPSGLAHLMEKRGCAGLLGVDCHSLPYVSSPPFLAPLSLSGAARLKMRRNEVEAKTRAFLFAASRTLGFYQIFPRIYFQPWSQKTDRGLFIHSLWSAPGDGLNLAG